MLFQFIKDILFGNETFQTSYYDDIIINQLLNDMRKVIDVKNTIRNGGILQKIELINRDLNHILTFIQRGNSFHFQEVNLKNDSQFEFQTEIARSFFFKLQQVCRGDLRNGAVANNYVTPKRIKTSSTDKETLKNILSDSSDSYLTFRDPQYWGDIAKQLLRKSRPLRLSSLTIPSHLYKNMMILYDIHCQSKGVAVDPFSCKLTSQDTYVDPIHLESTRSLSMFLENHKDHIFSQTIRAFVNNIVKSILNAEEHLLPINVLDNESQIKKLIRNITVLNDRVSEVNDNILPLKFIDVFLRILAVAKLDYLWESINLTFSPQEDDELKVYFLRNLELEREVKMLTHNCQNR